MNLGIHNNLNSCNFFVLRDIDEIFLNYVLHEMPCPKKCNYDLFARMTFSRS
jgi:hypothetical protein